VLGVLVLMVTTLAELSQISMRRALAAADARDKVVAIYDTMMEIFERAKREDRPTHHVIDAIVDERIFD
jgi:hypothetical protein